MCPGHNTTEIGCKCKDEKAYDIFEKTCVDHTFGPNCVLVGKFGPVHICYKC